MPNMRITRRASFQLANLVWLSPLYPERAEAEERTAKAHEPEAKDGKQASSEKLRLPADSSAPFTVNAGGRALSIKATAGSIRLVSEDGAPQAEIAAVSYQLDAADPAHRPVTFAINGGPGASSAWLHLGALGPWRLPMANLSPSSPPTLVDNEETWLDFTDLVFIDPPGTGYSRIVASGDEARKSFFSIEGDIDALSAVIRRWLVANGRLASPKFIVGESYGGFRGPQLAKRLATNDGVGLGGVILISPVLDFGSFFSGPFPLLTRLPSFAAAHREKKGPVARADLADVEEYSVGDYLQDWLRGPRDRASVERMSQRVAALTGLDPALVRRLGGEVDKDDFLQESERADGKVLAFYDATIAAYDPFPTDFSNRSLDPVLPGFEGPFSSAIVDLYERKLGWKIEDRYELLNGEVSARWDWGSGLHPAQSITDLRQMLALDPNFHALVSHGLTDVQAPYFASKLELDQIPDYGAPGRLTLKVYRGGHMHYSRDDTRKALHDDAKQLVERR